MKDVLDLFGDLPDYPGKRAPKNRPDVKTGAVHRADNPLEGVQKRVLTIKGEKRDFYTVGGLAQVVGRTALTIRSWERKGWIPAPTYRSAKPSGHQDVNTSKKGYRLYSKEQVLVIYESLETQGLIGTRNGSWQEPQRWLSFIEHVQANWPK